MKVAYTNKRFYEPSLDLSKTMNGIMANYEHHGIKLGVPHLYNQHAPHAIRHEEELESK
jgi:hypothetical protein